MIDGQAGWNESPVGGVMGFDSSLHIFDCPKMAFSYKNDKAQKQKMIMKIMKKQNNYHNNDNNDHGNG